MVRLGEATADEWEFAMTFQFQYGAIGSQSFRTGQHRLILVSIPVWCDWECLSRAMSCRIYLFQFQYGAIGSPQLPFGIESVEQFQFQYGAIGRSFATSIDI